MPRYLIERDMPGAGQLSDADLAAASQKSNEVLASMSPRARWLQSYVAEDPEAVREHAANGGFPVTTVHCVSTVIDPSTVEVA